MVHRKTLAEYWEAQTMELQKKLAVRWAKQTLKAEMKLTEMLAENRRVLMKGAVWKLEVSSKTLIPEAAMK